nr:GGDEF domain-containing protein [Sphingopyxis sp. PET50]
MAGVLPVVALALSCLLAAIVGGPGAIAFPVPALLWCGLTYRVFGAALLTFLYGNWALVVLAGGTGADAEMTMISIRLGAALVAIAPVTVASIAESRNELLGRLRHIAAHDHLTGTRARGAFLDDVRTALANARGPAAVLMVDIDHFKAINDNHGHAARRPAAPVLRRPRAVLPARERPFRPHGRRGVRPVPARDHPGRGVRDRRAHPRYAARRSLRGGRRSRDRPDRQHRHRLCRWTVPARHWSPCSPRPMPRSIARRAPGGTGSKSRGTTPSRWPSSTRRPARVACQAPGPAPQGAACSTSFSPPKMRCSAPRCC